MSKLFSKIDEAALEFKECYLPDLARFEIVTLSLKITAYFIKKRRRIFYFTLFTLPPTPHRRTAERAARDLVKQKGDLERLQKVSFVFLYPFCRSDIPNIYLSFVCLPANANIKQIS